MLVSLTVGKVDAGVAVLLTQDNRLIEFPSVLLPNNIASGSIVDITVARNHAAEEASAAAFQSLQKRILNTYGIKSPSPPVLRLRNATQTALVLEWDPIDLATASLKSLSLYRNGSKAGSIPKPFEMRSTKISGLAIHTEYTFHLVLRTSAGTYQSEKLTCRTHKMTDLSGITVTPGILPPQRKEALAAAVDRIGGKMIDTVRIDTTHFVCAEGKGPLWEKAVEMNIPVVLPEWVDACESEGTIVSVRGYYLNADPKARHLGPIHATTQQHQRTTSTVSSANAQPRSHLGVPLQVSRGPLRELSAGEPPVTPFPGAGMSGQPTEDEEKVSMDEDHPPPPPPPKDEETGTEQPPSGEQPEQNGGSQPAESNSPPRSPRSEGPPAEEEKRGEDKPAEGIPSVKEPEEDQQPSNGENKGETKEVEGDSFNEVPL